MTMLDKKTDNNGKTGDLIKTGEALRESEERFKDIAEASGEFFWEMDAEFRFTYASERLAVVLQRPLKEILGKTPFDFMLPEDAAKRKEYIPEALRKGKKIDVFSDRFVLPGGGIIWIETRAVSVFNGKGEITGFRGTGVDITEKKKAWLDLERKREFEDMVAEVSTSFVGAGVENIGQKIDDMLSKTGKFFKAARSYFFQLSVDGKKMTNVHEWRAEGIPPRGRDVRDSPLSEIPGWEKKIIGNEIVHFLDIDKFPGKASAERRRYREQGIRSILALPTVIDEFTVGFFGFELFRDSRDWDERDIHLLKVLVNVFADAFKKVRAEEQILAEKERAEEASRAKSEFLSVVSHELRTPLTIMKEGLSVVLEGLTGNLNPKQEKYLSMVDKNARRLSRLIGNVLDFQKFQYDKVEMDLRDNDINKIVEETAALYKQTADSRGLEFKITVDGQIPSFKFDADRITQVLVNLLDNAMKFTEEGGIAVKTERVEDDKVRISVSDTGRGLEDMDIKKIYNIFEQGSSARYSKSGGTGLGLPIARKIIEKHGGSIDVKKNPEKGVTFFFSLPVVDGEKNTASGKRAE